VVTLLVILPHTLLVPLLWGPLLKLNAWLSNYLVATFLITLTIVLSVVYVCMPPPLACSRRWRPLSPMSTYRPSAARLRFT
jgi:hypothetical protein